MTLSDLPEMMVPSHSYYFDHVFLDAGWQSDCLVTVKDGVISQIDPAPSPSSIAAAESIKGWALPGLPNLHSHCFQRGMAGLSERRGHSSDRFWTWREVMYRFLDRLDPEAVEDIAAFAMLEMIERGYTALAEFHYLHHDPQGNPYANRAEMAERIIAAAHKTGLCLTLLPVFYAHGNFGGQAPQEGQRRFINSLDGYEQLLGDTERGLHALQDGKIGVAPHSLRAVTEQELAYLLTLAPESPIHIHIAEQLKEVTDCVTWSGARPVEWLLDKMPVDHRWCLIHATHMNERETQQLAASQAIAGLCPITEANLGDGIFPATDFITSGGAFGVGSDSNIEISAAHEVRWLEYGQRLNLRGRNMLALEAGQSTGEALYRMACRSGAQALNQAIGSIAVGKRADFVVLNENHPSLAGHKSDSIMDSYLFVAGHDAIDRVIASGKTWVMGGRHHHHDDITRRYQACMKRILS